MTAWEGASGWRSFPGWVLGQGMNLQGRRCRRASFNVCVPKIRASAPSRAASPAAPVTDFSGCTVGGVLRSLKRFSGEVSGHEARFQPKEIPSP